MTMTLLLNATFEPIEIISWQRAMTLYVSGKVEVVSEHDVEARSVSFTFKLPSVVRLLRFVKLGRKATAVQFTRANIYARDDYTCQYCRTRYEPENLTFDHVVPAAAGGHRSWENIVTACVECNTRKGSRTPEEAEMVLARAPIRPRPGPLYLRVTIGSKRMPETWRDFLYWHVSMEER
jgi:5-methylcytosine-specific restriction endonuclease McrA